MVATWQQYGARWVQACLPVMVCRACHAVVWGACTIAAVGCVSNADRLAGIDTRTSSVGRVARLVERFRIAHRGRVPRTEQELRSFAASILVDDRALLGIADVDACFVSNRDGQPLALRLGDRERQSGDPAVVCYERAGRDGVRLVGRCGGGVELVDEGRFAEIVPGP